MVCDHPVKYARGLCKPCYMHDFRAKNPEKIALYNRQDRERRGDRIRAYDRARNKTPKRRAAKQAFYAKNPDAKRDHKLKTMYGISLDDFNRMLVEQGGVCAICRSPDFGRKRCNTFSVDHDHETGRVRGLLCTSCNTGLGKLKDSSEVLSSAIAYLRKHGK